MSLYDLKIGEKAKIDNLTLHDKLRKRLVSLGLTKDTEIEIVRVAPLGDPLVINVRGCEFAVRKADAKKILINQTAQEVINA